MSYLCSFHIPKVGGTTFASHARGSLDDETFLLHGPFSRVDRFLRNRPQVEELPDAARRAIRVVHGHDAGLPLAEVMVGQMPDFMVILREPYARYVSGLNHANNERRNNGLTTFSEDEYLSRRGTNYYAKTLRWNFEGLAPSGKELSVASLMPVLRSIKHFVLTERLESQLQEICQQYGLRTGEIPPQRVNKTKAARGVDRDTFSQHNSVDQEIYAVVAKAAGHSSGLIANPFGYDPGPLARHLEGVWSNWDAKDRLRTAYERLVTAAQKTFKLEAIHLKLVHGHSGHVRDKDLLLAATREGLDGWIATLDSEELAAAHTWSGHMFMKERKLDAAEQYLRKAIDLNARNENALALLAKILLSRGMKDDAAIYIDRAVSLRPERVMTQKLRRAIMDS